MVLKYQESNQYFLMTNTVDSLRSVQSLMQSGVPILLDEVGGDQNDAQVIHKSVNMWKALLQGKNPSQIRARNNDIHFAARQPKIITANCMDLCDWIDTVCPQDKEPTPQHHRDAIKSRVAECEQIKESLYSDCMAQDVSFLPAQKSTQEVAAAMNDLFR